MSKESAKKNFFLKVNINLIMKISATKKNDVNSIDSYTK